MPKGTEPIDVAFLEEIRWWRRILAEDIAWRNPDLDVVGLSGVVQSTIDRLIFLRIAEARGLEPVNNLFQVAESGSNIYQRLVELFKRADDRYNSGLFHFDDSAGVKGEPDHVSLTVAIGSPPLTRIIERMYFPQPYEFSVMPADILGRIYEQFLGEIIELNDDRSVTISLKPELRRAGGVYYTPTPIVDYIVEETVGPLLKGKSPNEVRNLNIVDPACGSGSFLIAVFQYLLDWHRSYYAEHPRLAMSS